MPSNTPYHWQREKDERKRQLKKKLKRNRKPKRVRQKEWIPADLDALDDLYATPQDERMMPKGERERRRAAVAEALAALEAEREQEQPQADARLPGPVGIVVQVSSSLCRVEVEGSILTCGIRGSLSAEESGFTNVIAAGDRVVVSPSGSQQGVVEAVLPRQSILARPDVFHDGDYRTRDRHQQQIIVANAEQLLIVASWRQPSLWPELIDRYLIAAARSDLSPVICVNKIDLAEDIAACQARVAPYAQLGYPILFTSAVTGDGVGDLRRALKDKVTVLAGLSGVGKSTLLTAVQPDLGLRIGHVSDSSHQGRHTTTQVSLINLAMGGYVADTPGIREFGLSGLAPDDLIGFYPEIGEAAAACRFGDCTHSHEPGCAVKAQVARGEVSADRFKSYQELYRSLTKRAGSA